MTGDNENVQAWWDKLGFKDQRALLEQSHNEPLSTWLTEAVEAAGRSFDTDRGRLTPEEWAFIGKQGADGEHGHEGHGHESHEGHEHGGHDHDGHEHGDHGHHSGGGGGL